MSTTGTRSLLRAAGLLVWAFAGGPAALRLWRDPTCGIPGTLPIWIAAFAVFGVAFFRATRADAPEGAASLRLIGWQTFAAIAMNVFLCTGFEAALFVVVAVQVGLALPLGRGLLWLAAQSGVAAILASVHMGATTGAIWSIGVIGAEAFAFTVAAMAGREAEARRALERTNADLRATRASLERATRDAERLRIARELHDLLGHDLVALHLELETAHHLARGQAEEPVERARLIAKSLLADVREAVSRLREEPGAVDVTEGVRAVLAKVQAPRIHFDAPATVYVGDGERANTVVRCVQEIVTNAIKHANAENLWITLCMQDGAVELSARDDGRGARALEPGHGLAGMRERFEELGGAIVLETDLGAGFRLRATLPESRARAPEGPSA